LTLTIVKYHCLKLAVILSWVIGSLAMTHDPSWPTDPFPSLPQG